MTAESAKPRMSGQRISHPMAKAMPSACKTAVNMMSYSTSFRPCNRPKRNQFRKYALAGTEAAALTVKRHDTAWWRFPPESVKSQRNGFGRHLGLFGCWRSPDALTEES